MSGSATARRRQLDPTLARQRNVILAGLALITVASWVWVVGGATGSMPAGAAGLGLTMGMGAWAFVAMWAVMMVGMMFPASAPMALAYAAIQARRRATGRPYVPVSVFMAAYMVIWTAFGVAALGLAVGLEALARHWPWLAAHWPRCAAGLIVAAGLYQLTPLKHMCLRRCRSPLGFLLVHWRDGPAGAFRMGLDHGLYCAGCCWLLFVILLPLGVMNLTTMAVITIVVFAEKTLPHGNWTARLAGGALVGYGLLVWINFASLPGQ